ncbi:MAG TPA: hypothetical protein VGG16_14210 [Streptosporangiaceae bacterium]
MAPPIPGLRPPAQYRRRTAGDFFISLFAIIALLGLMLGVPIALVETMGLPLPHARPQLSSLSVLTHQADAATILHILEVILWLAWIQLVWCVLVEVKASVSHRQAAAKVPLAGVTQSLAHRLVLAAMLFFTAAAALAPAFSGSGAAPPAHSISAQVTSQRVGAIMHGLPGGAQEVSQVSSTGKIYVVQPPEGRFHESLWEIAQKHLGDGRRYHEIFQLNKDKVQPDGTKLTIASLIRPGWVLVMPHDANGPGIATVRHDMPGTQAPAGTQQGSGGGAQGIVASPAVAGQQQHAPSWPYELSSASLLAAGVLVALGRRRREQLWRRAFGRRLAVPRGDAALAEQALRFGADDPAVRMLDKGLRQLGQQLGAQGRTPPTVFAAHVGTDNLDLWIAPPDPNPPRPWVPADGGQVWRLPVPAIAGLDPGNALAPYPGLVSLGTNASGRILVDLEVAHGLIAVRGPRHMVQAALAALAVELVTNQWSDRMRVTLVGFGDGLQSISSERIVVLPTLDEALPQLEERAQELRSAMAAAGIDSVLTGRAQTTDPSVWAPHYLIMGVPPTPEQAQRLRALARSRHRTAAGYVVAGDVPGASWAWDLTEDGRLRADALGFDLKAQLLVPEQYAALVQLFQPPAGNVPLSPLAAGNAPPAHLLPGTRMPVEVAVLGPVTVQAPGMLDADRLALATELVVYLATHPAGVHMNVLTGAIWPRGVSPEVRDSALARVHAWLGAGPNGEPNLVTDAEGRLRLGPGVRVDWQVFRALLNRASQASTLQPGTAGAGGAEAAQLEQALELVRGQFLDQRDPARYGWLATDDVGYEVTALVADAAHRLSGLCLAAGRAQDAMEAARAGLRLAFNDELLWRDLILGAHATGKDAVLRAAVAEVSTRTALDEVMPRMAPETEALIDELLPSWRTSAA